MQLIQKLQDDQKCMKKVEPSSRSKAIQDIISIGSFVEALVLNHYVLVRKILGKLIQKLLLSQKCMGFLVRAYYRISPTRYYKDDSWWSADLKSNEKQILENFDMTRSVGI
uniref:Uncharacterized protein n=1 Tax=Tanacetum cinerariifolium TaxID=118510 RepID=A0A699HL61_TANCI|nr:hypothetical protein [Tanacetum cinerariifolium]